MLYVSKGRMSSGLRISTKRQWWSKITFISIFFSHNRAYTESTWPSFRLLAPPLGTDTPPLYQLTRDWYIPIPQISAGVFTYQLNMHQNWSKQTYLQWIKLHHLSYYSCVHTRHYLQSICSNKDHWFCGDATASLAHAQHHIAVPSRARAS